MRSLTSVQAVGWEGGGIKALAYPPVVAALEEDGAVVKRHVGASAGAITAMALVMGYNAEELDEMLLTTPWGVLIGAKWRVLSRLWGLLHRKALFSSEPLRRWLTDVAAAKGFGGACFHDLSQATGLDLRVAVSNLTTMRTEIASAQWTPFWPVVDTVLASASIPGVFPPVEIGGQVLVDGGVAANHPLEEARDGLRTDQVLGVRIDTPGEVSGMLLPPPDDVLTVLARSFALAQRASESTWVPDDLWPRVVRIVTSVGALDFDLKPHQQRYLRTCGKVAVEEWRMKDA